MSYKIVSELRKKGELEQALAMAKDDFAYAQNTWSASALFWVLYDISKQKDTDFIDILSQMEPLIKFMDSPEIAQKCFARMQQQTDSTYKSIEQALASAKSGDTKSGYSLIKKLYKENGLGQNVHENAAWIIYYYLKQLNVKNTEELSEAVDIYWTLGIQRPSIIHSVVLWKVLQFSEEIQNYHVIYNFISHDGALLLRSEDWESNDYSKAKPLAVKIISCFTKIIEKTGADISDEMLALARKSSEQFKDDVFLKRNLAIILSAKGKREDALKIYRDILKTKDDSYLWDELARLTDSTVIRIAALCKALLCLDKPEFTLMTHLRLAFVLAGQQDFPRAKYELSIYEETCRRNGWKIKAAYNQVADMIPEDTRTEITGKQFYSKYMPVIEEFMYGDVQSTVLYSYKEFEIDRNGKKIKNILLVGKDETRIKVRKKRLETIDRNYMYRCYEAKIIDNRIVCIKASDKDILDVFDVQYAKIDNVNPDKKVYHLANKKGVSAVIPFMDRRNYNLGDELEIVAIRNIRKDGRVSYDILYDSKMKRYQPRKTNAEW